MHTTSLIILRRQLPDVVDRDSQFGDQGNETSHTGTTTRAGRQVRATWKVRDQLPEQAGIVDEAAEEVSRKPKNYSMLNLVYDGCACL